MYSKSLTKEIEKIIKETSEIMKCSYINKVGYNVSNFADVVNFDYLVHRFKLSDEFIEKFQNQFDFNDIFRYQRVGEEFIEKFQGKIKKHKNFDWYYLCREQKLSESIIEKFKDKVDWSLISSNQNLSESFIEKFQDQVDWYNISMYQKLSESFIEKFKDKIYWSQVSKFQKLSEPFLKKFRKEIRKKNISRYQKLSMQFRKKYEIKIDEWNWLYKPVNFKLKYIKEKTNYEVIDDKYIIAYKGIRSNSYSKFNFQYKYEVGKTYESHCDCNSEDENSFGLSAWNIESAKKYCGEKIIKVKIAIKDIGCIVKKSNKIRCFRFEVIE